MAFLLQHCTITMPLTALALNDIQEDVKIKNVSLLRLEKGDQVMIITPDHQLVEAEVISYYRVQDKSIRPTGNKYTTIVSEFNKTELPKPGDTLTVACNSLIFNGIFTGMNYHQLLLENEKGQQEIIPINKITTMYKNGSLFSHERLTSIYQERVFTYELKVLVGTEEKIYSSDDILEIKKEYRSNNLFVAFLGGIIADFVVLWIGFSSISLPIA